jgi:transposase
MPIFVATAPIDLRRSFDGLAAAAREQLGRDPQRGALFLFFNKAQDRVKLLWWDRTGYCILYKRLQRGCFRLPKAIEADATSVSVEAAELAKILEGVALPPSKLQPRGIVDAPAVLPSRAAYSA